jgi:hypothetical protein
MVSLGLCVTEYMRAEMQRQGGYYMWIRVCMTKYTCVGGTEVGGGHLCVR